MERICWGLLCAAGSCLCGIYGTEAAKEHRRLEIQPIEVHMESIEADEHIDHIGDIPKADANSAIISYAPMSHERMPRL